MANTDLLCSTLLALVEVTQQLCAKIESNSLDPLEDLLDRRGQLLEQQSFLLLRWKDSGENADNKMRDLARLKPLVELLQRSDEKLNKLVLQKRDEVGEQLRLAQNQKRLLAYAR